MRGCSVCLLDFDNQNDFIVYLHSQECNDDLRLDNDQLDTHLFHFTIRLL